MPATQTAMAPQELAVYPAVLPPGAAHVTETPNKPGEALSPNIRHRDLMEAIVSNQDRDAFAELFDFFAPRLKSYVMRIGADPSSAEELAQETMVTVWRKAATYDSAKAAVSTWIFTIARNRRIDQARRENRPAVDEHDLTGEVRWQESAFGDIQAAEEQAILSDAIDSLPEEQAEVIRKAFFEDKSHGAVAGELGLPLGTVKSRIRLALGHLKRTVSETLR